MNTKELIKRAKATVITQEMVDAMMARQRAKEKIWTEHAQDQANRSQEFKNRVYTL
jgi:hypothetical protein